MKEFITIGYSYSELNEQAQAKVKEWYLNDPIRNNIFYEDCKMALEEYTRSGLQVDYSLGYCQGDGLNITGTVNLYDFLERWEASEKEKRRMEVYIDNSLNTYTFSSNYHYSYSCKFIDRKNISDTVEEFISYLNAIDFKNINVDTIKKFYSDMIEHFRELEKEWEKAGYDYLYDCSEEEVQEACEANDWYFDENGNFIG